MVRYVTPAEYQRLLREQQRAIDQHNRQVHARNQETQRRAQAMARAIDDHNRRAEQHNREVLRRHRQAVDNHNHQVRAHNAQVLANRQRLESLLNQLRSRTVSPVYSALNSSTEALNDAFARLDRRAANESSDANDDLILDYPARESANSVELLNALLGQEQGDQTEADIQQTEIDAELKQLSPDLDQRWRGALYSLSPRNPDAARHFCTSARELVTTILELRAPDAAVLSATPDCAINQENKPTRRAKIQYLVQRHGIDSAELGDFIDADISNIVDLFNVFNSATHGDAGRYDFPKLRAIKKRVEGGILFLARLTRRPVN